MPTEYYCDATEDHVHVIDFASVTQADVAEDADVMDVNCKACGRSGSFRLPKVSEIDW